MRLPRLAFEHPNVLSARERKLNVLQGASLTDVYGAVHSAPFGDFASTNKYSFPKGYTNSDGSYSLTPRSYSWN